MQFEPFLDRLSRDIRNDLAATVGTMLDKRDIGPVQKVADQYLGSDIASCYREYIEERLVRYRSVLKQIGQESNDVFRQALVLWDHNLFFEVHEILEHAWVKASGREKKIFQAMIRAAGVYIKMEYGYSDAARKIARKALPVLKANKTYLADYFEPEKLLSSLQDSNPHPPRLLD